VCITKINSQNKDNYKNSFAAKISSKNPCNIVYNKKTKTKTKTKETYCPFLTIYSKNLIFNLSIAGSLLIVTAALINISIKLLYREKK